MTSLKDIQMQKTDRTVVKDVRKAEFRNWEEQAHRRYLKSVGKEDTGRDDDDMVDILARQGNTVGIGIRLLAWFVDYLIVTAPMKLASFFSYGNLTQEQTDNLKVNLSEAPGMGEVAKIAVAATPWPVVIAFGLTAILGIMNYLILPATGRFKATFAQSLFNIEIIVTSTGRHIGFFRNALRFFLYAFGPWIALFMVAWLANNQIAEHGALALLNPIWIVLFILAADGPYAIAMFNEKKRCLHDFLTGTRLRYRSSFEE